MKRAKDLFFRPFFMRELFMKKAFTLVEMMIVVAIIAILAMIAIPNIIRLKLNANETNALAVLKTLSSAFESYTVANDGEYPTDISLLINSNPPYLNEDYTNGQPRRGYVFTAVSMQRLGYCFTATPLSKGITGNKIYSIRTGSINGCDDPAMCSRPPCSSPTFP